MYKFIKKARTKKIISGTLAILFSAFSLTFFAHSPKQQAYASSLTSTDYQVPSGKDPWGTAFDTNGNVWVALPGCDPSPDCGSSTPPGKIEVFNPSTSSWIATYNLPAGYGQPLFLAFDASGNVWFPMFHINALGEY